MDRDSVGHDVSSFGGVTPDLDRVDTPRVERHDDLTRVDREPGSDSVRSFVSSPRNARATAGRGRHHHGDDPVINRAGAMLRTDPPPADENDT